MCTHTQTLSHSLPMSEREQGPQRVASDPPNGYPARVTRPAMGLDRSYPPSPRAPGVGGLPGWTSLRTPENRWWLRGQVRYRGQVWKLTLLTNVFVFCFQKTEQTDAEPVRFNPGIF